SGRKAGNKVGWGGESSRFGSEPDRQIWTAPDRRFQIEAGQPSPLWGKTKIWRGQAHYSSIATLALFNFYMRVFAWPWIVGRIGCDPWPNYLLGGLRRPGNSLESWTLGAAGQ